VVPIVGARTPAHVDASFSLAARAQTQAPTPTLAWPGSPWLDGAQLREVERALDAGKDDGDEGGGGGGGCGGRGAGEGRAPPLPLPDAAAEHDTRVSAAAAWAPPSAPVKLPTPAKHGKKFLTGLSVLLVRSGVNMSQGRAKVLERRVAEAGGTHVTKLSQRPTHIVADATLGAERLQAAVGLSAGERKGGRGTAAVEASGAKVCRLQWLDKSLELQARIQEQGYLW
jgi:hypothetical protein